MNIKEGFGDFARVMEPMPCIGIAGLSSALKEAGHQVLCIDNFAHNLSFGELLRTIDDFSPSYVGQSCLTPTALTVFDFNRFIKEKRPHIKTILGNVHASVFAKEILEKGESDYVLEGECEYSLPKLLDALESGRRLNSIPGLHYLSTDSRRPKFTGPSKRIMDLDALPRPDWNSLPWKKYTFLPFVTIALPAMAIMGSRGCPYNCTFCALGYQGKYRLREAGAIAREMQWLIRDFGAKHIGFVDPIFPIHKKHLFEMCELIRKQGIPKDVAWTSETRVDCIDKEMLVEMKSANFRRLLLGVESGEDRLLKKVKKNFTVNQVRRAIGLAKEVGLETCCFFILGLPGETREETMRTVSLPIELDVDFAKFAILVPLPGSGLFDELIKSGKLTSEDWTKFTTFNPSGEDLPFVPENMTGDQLLTLQKKANFKFYFRLKIIFRHLFIIRTISIKHLFSGFIIWLRWKFQRN